MELAYQFLAQAADTSPDGLIHALGIGFDTAVSDEFPAALLPFAFVVSLRVAPEEVGQPHHYRTELCKPSGEWTILSGPQPINTVPHPLRPELPSAANIVMRIGLTFDGAGDYQLRVVVDDIPMESAKLRILRRLTTPT